MKVKSVDWTAITVELTPGDAVSLAHLCQEGAAELTDAAQASRLLVPRAEYYEALGAALRAGALAAVCYGHLGPSRVKRLNEDLREVGLA